MALADAFNFRSETSKSASALPPRRQCSAVSDRRHEITSTSSSVRYQHMPIFHTRHIKSHDTTERVQRRGTLALPQGAGNVNDEGSEDLPSWGTADWRRRSRQQLQYLLTSHVTSCCQTQLVFTVDMCKNSSEKTSECAWDYCVSKVMYCLTE